MEPIHAHVRVDFHFDVLFTHDLFAPDNSQLREIVHQTDDLSGEKRPSRILFVVDETVDRALNLTPQIEVYCAFHEDVECVADVLRLPGGETVKNSPEHAERVLNLVNQVGLDRHSYIVVIGGGAILDAVGYAAATAHRGVRLIRVPTTTLSMDDSGVGVKNAINSFGKKNFVGTFAPPFAVVIDLKFLETLPQREWRGGISEAIKVALLKDAEFFRFLEECAPAIAGRDLSAMAHLIRRSAELHVQHICTSGDAFEMGSSRPLDFGHWAAHKLEQITNYRLHHGEAVAIGLALDVTYSHLMGWLEKAEWERILNTLVGVGFDIWTPHLTDHLNQPQHTNNVFRGLHEFREHLGGRLTIAMLRGIGEGFDVHEICDETMLYAMRILEQKARELNAVRERDVELVEA